MSERNQSHADAILDQIEYEQNGMSEFNRNFYLKAIQNEVALTELRIKVWLENALSDIEEAEQEGKERQAGKIARLHIRSIIKTIS